MAKRIELVSLANISAGSTIVEYHGKGFPAEEFENHPELPRYIVLAIVKEDMIALAEEVQAMNELNARITQDFPVIARQEVTNPDSGPVIAAQVALIRDPDAYLGQRVSITTRCERTVEVVDKQSGDFVIIGYVKKVKPRPNRKWVYIERDI